MSDKSYFVEVNYSAVNDKFGKRMKRMDLENQFQKIQEMVFGVPMQLKLFLAG